MGSDPVQSAASKKSSSENQLFGRHGVVRDKDRDAALVADCLAGDRDAMSSLVSHYQKPVFNAAYRILGNSQDAADVAQTVFLKAFENLRKFDPRYKFFSWIYRITVNESISASKQRKPQQSHDYADASALPSAEQLIDESRISRQVQEVLMTLTEEQRVLIALKHFSELSYHDIGTILDIPEKTVKSRLYSARQHMKKALVERGIKPS